MIDLGQFDAIKNQKQRPVNFTWQTVKQNYSFLCGTLCVIRQGEVLAIEPQWHWKEYTGAFSLLNTPTNNTANNTANNAHRPNHKGHA